MKESDEEIIVYGFDNSIIQGDSTKMFVRFTTDNYLKYLWIIFKSLPFCLCKKSRRNEFLLRCAMKDVHRDEILRRSQRFVTLLNRTVSGRMISEIQSCRSKGQRVAVVSSTAVEILRSWAKQYEIKYVYGNELEYDEDGYFTGRFVSRCDEKDMRNRIEGL